MECIEKVVCMYWVLLRLQVRILGSLLQLKCVLSCWRLVPAHNGLNSIQKKYSKIHTTLRSEQLLEKDWFLIAMLFVQSSSNFKSHLIFAILQFEISSLKELDFFLSLNCIFLPAVACKIQVWNRQKIQFLKLDI